MPAPISYAIRHITTFNYDTPVSESVMELRMRPVTTAAQRCLQFEVDVQPRTRVFAYRDFLGNWVHHFDVPRRHGQLTVIARSQVQIDQPLSPAASIDLAAWQTLDAWAANGDEWDFRQTSRFIEWSPALLDFAATTGAADRSMDPLATVRSVMHAIHSGFEYVPKSTQVDSPIDVALAARKGVCQDFAHIMIATLRHAGIPCRYVSGYIAPSRTGGDGEAQSIATHAWVDVRLPGVGWFGVDPTHNIDVSDRHVPVAVGRDYADVPPTRGVFKGKTTSTLAVSVEVTSGDALPTIDRAVLESSWAATGESPKEDDEVQFRQQQQQQQQQ